MSHSQQVTEQDLTQVIWLSSSALNYWTRLPCSGPPLPRERPSPKDNTKLTWRGLRKEVLSVESPLSAIKVSEILLTRSWDRACKISTVLEIFLVVQWLRLILLASQ